MSAAESDDDGTPAEAPTNEVKAKKATKKKARASEKAAASATVDESESFVEGNHQTVMTYGHGGFPKYIMAVWVCFLVGYAVYFYVYGLPDLTAWGSP